MEILHLNEKTFSGALEKATTILRHGGVIACPTDTVYGLVCDAGQEVALGRMFAMKHRPGEKAFPIFVHDVAMARQYAYISDAKAMFLEKIWPGPVTAVFHHKEKLPPLLTGNKGTIAIRIPDHPFPAALLARLDMPFAQTSANISDMPASKSAEDVKKYFEHADAAPDLLIDGGEVQGTSSTVIDCTGSSPFILRSGVISKADIDRMLGTS